MRKINGIRTLGPHQCVNKLINKEGHPGVYEGDKARQNGTGAYNNGEVYIPGVHELAVPALQEMIQHDNFLAFIHFTDPDLTGHQVINGNIQAPAGQTQLDVYKQSALEVDNYIWDLMQILPSDTNIIYCSDHGFDFISEGDAQDHHDFSPLGMLATNFTTIYTGLTPPQNPDGSSYFTTSQMSIGRLIYKLAGGNPDRALPRKDGAEYYLMSGEDLI